MKTIKCKPENHIWFIYSTAVNDGVLLAKCFHCNSYGSVDNPTKEEWSKAFHAPSNPYRWYETDRVITGK